MNGHNYKTYNQTDISQDHLSIKTEDQQKEEDKILSQIVHRRKLFSPENKKGESTIDPVDN